ncbi:MAG TPA: glycosyltransferase [Telluria sp.]
MPLHSIVMPVYNGERYLAESIRSVLDQDCADLELIVVDDCSSDRSTDIVQEFAAHDARVRPASTAINSGGPAMPKNVGLALARGEFVSFCDQDDVLLPHKLARASGVFASFPQLDLVFFDFRPFSALGGTQQPYLAGKKFTEVASSYLEPAGGDVYLCRNYWGCMAGLHMGISTQTVVCRRALLDGRRFDTRFRIVDDIALWHRVAETARIAFVNQPVALYRDHEQALTGDSALLSRETVAFHRENYFRQRHLFSAEENRRYRQMLACFFVRNASLPELSELEKRSHLLQSLLFDFRFRTLRWFLRTFAAKQRHAR